MSNTTSGRKAAGRSIWRRRGGFTQIELAIAIEVVGLLTMMAVNQTQRAVAYAQVAQCVLYQRSVRDGLWMHYCIDGEFPSQLGVVVGDFIRPCPIDGGFRYLGGEDANHGHGNDWDGVDGDNPGHGQEDAQDEPGFYLRCNHDHSRAGVLYVECGSHVPPRAVRNHDEAAE